MIKIPLYYLGVRDYVNGLTLFEEMVKAFNKEVDREKKGTKAIHRIQTFKVNRFIRTNCFLDRQEGQSTHSPISDSAAQMNIETIDRHTIKLLLYEDKNQPAIERREEYDRSIYIGNERLNQDGTMTVSLNNITDAFALVRGLVEANYRYCVSKALNAGSKSPVSWAYFSNLKWPSADDFSIFGEIRFREKSEIHHNNRCYIIRKFSIEGLKTENESEICFFYDDPDFAS